MNNQEIKLVMAKIEDLVNGTIKNQSWSTTWFLDPTTQIDIERYLSGNREISYKKAGGYPLSERNIFAIYPDWMEFDDNLFPLCGISIEWDNRYDKIGHRDILGSILGLGIKREKIGDIIVNDNISHVIAMDDIAPFIVASLTKVGKATVRVADLDLENLDIPEPKFKDIRTTVPSMRLDCLASSGFGFSRSKILPYIRDGRIFVNWEQITKPDYQIKEGDLITLRGSGRIRITEVSGFTRKKRITVVIQKYI